MDGKGSGEDGGALVGIQALEASHPGGRHDSKDETFLKQTTNVTEKVIPIRAHSPSGDPMPIYGGLIIA